MYNYVDKMKDNSMKKLSVLILVLLAVVSAVIGVVYFTKTAANLPHYFPGHAAGSSAKHLKHGVAFVALAVILLVGAWVMSGERSTMAPGATKPDHKDKHA